MLLEAYARTLAWRTYLRSGLADRGVETLEWIGMAAVVLALTGAVALFMKTSGGNTIAEQIVTTITTLLQNLTKTE